MYHYKWRVVHDIVDVEVVICADKLRYNPTILLSTFILVITFRLACDFFVTSLHPPQPILFQVRLLTFELETSVA